MKAAVVLIPFVMIAADWPQFRGPNGSGVSIDAAGLPVEFGPDKNVIWKTALPPGHSSPVLTENRIFVTAFEGKKLLVISLDRATGKLMWKREVPRPREQKLHTSNSPASPSPVTDGTNVYVFLTDFGLISFDANGTERWRMPLGPFNNPFGMGASPILAGDTLLMVCDSETGSFFIAVDKNTGRPKWRIERPDVTRGFSTPVLYQPEKGPLQVLVAGAYRLMAYSVENGESLWWVRGLTWQLKPTPVLGRDVIYVQCWAGGADTGQQENIAPFEDALRRWDANHDGRLSKQEITDSLIQKNWEELDLDGDGYLGMRDWEFYRTRRSAQNGLNAFRLGGGGDVTEKNFLWRYEKSLPNVPSPLLYKGVLYMLKEGGILTAVNPDNGAVLKQARIAGAPGAYFSSPVAGDDKLFTLSEEGKMAVIKPGRDWEVLRVNDLGEECHATPAIAGGRIYVRTHGTLYCFGTDSEPRP